MNKVITINLGGTAYQLEEGGYDALRAYLETAAARLQGNPDRDEIMSDVEQAIGEKFRALLNNYKTVVVTSEVAAVLAEMGPVEADASAPETSSTTSGGGADATGPGDNPPPTGTTPGAARRLYRIREGEMLAGVCNGLAAYLNLDPTIVRLAFVLLTALWGTGALVYLVLAIVVPTANSPADKAAAYGAPFTTQEFVRRARAGYYEAMKSFPDRHARRAWKRQFKQDMRGWRMSFRWQFPRHPLVGVGAPSGAGFALPLFSLLHGALTIAWIGTLVSLLATGTLFGVVLPDDMPVWGALLALLFVYGFLAWPLKAARRAFYYGGGARSTWPVACAVDVVVWLAVAIVMVWLAVHYRTEARAAIRHLPAVIREAMHTIKDWWAPK